MNVWPLPLSQFQGFSLGQMVWAPAQEPPPVAFPGLTRPLSTPGGVVPPAQAGAGPDGAPLGGPASQGSQKSAPPAVQNGRDRVAARSHLSVVAQGLPPDPQPALPSPPSFPWGRGPGRVRPMRQELIPVPSNQSETWRDGSPEPEPLAELLDRREEIRSWAGDIPLLPASLLPDPVPVVVWPPAWEAAAKHMEDVDGALQALRDILVERERTAGPGQQDLPEGSVLVVQAPLAPAVAPPMPPPRPPSPKAVAPPAPQKGGRAPRASLPVPQEHPAFRLSASGDVHRAGGVVVTATPRVFGPRRRITPSPCGPAGPVGGLPVQPDMSLLPDGWRGFFINGVARPCRSWGDIRRLYSDLDSDSGSDSLSSCSDYACPGVVMNGGGVRPVGGGPPRPRGLALRGTSPPIAM